MNKLIVFFAIAFCFLISSFSAVAKGESNSPEVVKSFDVGLLDGLKKQKILVLKPDPGGSAQRLVLTSEVEGKESVVIAAPLALPLIENPYSPASFNGFDVGVLKEKVGLVSFDDSSGQVVEFNYGLAGAGEYINLKMVEEDNSVYRFDLRFKYDSMSKRLGLKYLFLSIYNNRCDMSLLSVYAVSPGRLDGVALDDFNGREVFYYLHDLYFDSQRNTSVLEKLMLKKDAEYLNEALGSYRAENLPELKKLMSYFVADGGASSVCQPSAYMVKKYYFPQKIEWSNNLGFLLEQSGYYSEAVEILEYIVLKNPTRMVAYLNLADSYWGMGNKKQAAANYEKYRVLMMERGLIEGIPNRVRERI
ncbi:tetratricopeptide repeat protein [Pseudomonas saponiphila]|uniref:tetratricopeptide repeat protein n=1 Tax=Pseudomonas saponiphila TaxID=556534 RepID=UPI00223EA021|nr:tetratricopeptide repeat protein [Pseudomonas saponiphila]